MSQKIKYSAKFQRDFEFYMKVRQSFNFDGSKDYTNKLGENNIQFNINGVDGKKAFYDWDTNGKISSTKHPNILKTLFKVKGSINLHIKMYAEDRANGRLPKLLFKEEICDPLNVPDWFIEAVENQKYRYY